MRRRALTVSLAAAFTALPAWAQTTRPFPANALRGSLEITLPPLVLLNGSPARLSPGSRIRGADNLLQLSGSLVGQTLTVNYTVETQGMLHDVWILTPEEAAKKPWPTSAEQALRWQFNPSAQTWTRR